VGLRNYIRLAVDKPKPVITADWFRWYCTLVESILEWPLESLLGSLLGGAVLGRAALRMEERFPREALANGKL
jgi:hypothetical protein